MMLIITCSVSENRRMFCLCLVIGSKPLILELGGLIKNPHAHLSTSIYLTVNPTDSLFIYISTSHRRIVIFFASMRNTTFSFFWTLFGTCIHIIFGAAEVMWRIRWTASELKVCWKLIQSIPGLNDFTVIWCELLCRMSTTVFLPFLSCCHIF